MQLDGLREHHQPFASLFVGQFAFACEVFDKDVSVGRGISPMMQQLGEAARADQ